MNAAWYASGVVTAAVTFIAWRTLRRCWQEAAPTRRAWADQIRADLVDAIQPTTHGPRQRTAPDGSDAGGAWMMVPPGYVAADRSEATPNRPKRKPAGHYQQRKGRAQ